jgi:DNA polymerase I-like protein with 3'-5' exonuclease and polymerase domains
MGPGVTRSDAYIIGLGIGTDDGRKWYLPTRHDGGGNLDEAMVRSWARRELNLYDGELVGAHLLYDLEHLSAWGIDFPLVTSFHDVLLADPLIDEWHSSYSLEAVSRRHLGEGKVEEMLLEAAEAMGIKDREIKANLWRLPAGWVGAYAEGDVDLPERVLQKQLPILAEQGLMGVYDVERGLTPLLLAMRLRGVRVNVQNMERIKDEMAIKRDEQLARARHLAGTDKIELMAAESFAPVLQERGYELPVTGKTKKPSVTKSWLKEHLDDPLVLALYEGRRLDKLIGTFIDGNLRYAVGERIHPEFPQLKRNKGIDGEGDSSGTIARFAGQHPNLQFQPSRDPELASMVRGFFLPDEGEDWFRMDESQIEFRLLVHYAIGPGSDEARSRYNTDPTTDFHVLAGEMLGATDPDDRKRVKNTNFCKVYMGGDQRLAQTFGCSLEEAQAFSQVYDQRLPFVRSTGMAAMRTADHRGYVLSILGRRQRFDRWEPARQSYNKDERRAAMLPLTEARERYGPGVKRAFTHAALNRVLQASAADVLKTALVNTWRSGVCSILGAPLINVHDENNWSVPRTKVAQEAIAEAKRLMEVPDPIQLRVPLRVDWSQGANWGEAK